MNDIEKLKQVLENAGMVEQLLNKANRIFKKYEEYQNLEEQGLLIKLPCKVGTDIFRIVDKRIGRGCNRKFNKTIQRGKAQWDDYDKFGKTAFLTREEAENKLKELEVKNEKITEY